MVKLWQRALLVASFHDLAAWAAKHAPYAQESVRWGGARPQAGGAAARRPASSRREGAGSKVQGRGSGRWWWRRCFSMPCPALTCPGLTWPALLHCTDTWPGTHARGAGGRRPSPRGLCRPQAPHPAMSAARV
jgi:hypothetical protein